MAKVSRWLKKKILHIKLIMLQPKVMVSNQTGYRSIYLGQLLNNVIHIVKY